MEYRVVVLGFAYFEMWIRYVKEDAVESLGSYV